MVSFLVKTDRYGIVEEILWSQPISLISRSQISIYDIFSLEQHDLLKTAFKKALLSDKMHYCDQKFHLRNFDTCVRCCMVAYNEQVLVLSAEIDDEQGERGNSAPFEIINRMMWQCMRLMENKTEHKHSDSINQFDQIQKLNNELVNTHRKLQKANAQLNSLNQELNNRLVKDVLTGLVSRYQYRSEIELLIGTDPLALGVFVFIDIDHFKKVNDTYGHSVGDAFLVGFSDRLRKLSIFGSMIFMRISGDEFGVYVHGLDIVDNIYLETFWQQFHRLVVADPLELNGLLLPISCSLGMAVYGQDTRDIYNLIDYADFAMYEAKAAGKGRYSQFNLESYELAKKNGSQ